MELESRGTLSFKLLNRQGWHLSNHNPVKMLNRMDGGALQEAAKDPHFLRHYDATTAKFKATWMPQRVVLRKRG